MIANVKILMMRTNYIIIIFLAKEINQGGVVTTIYYITLHLYELKLTLPLKRQ